MPPHIGASETFGPERLSLSRLLGRDPGVKQKLQWMTYAELQAERAASPRCLSHPPTRKSTARTEMKVQQTVQEKINTALARLLVCTHRGAARHSGFAPRDFGQSRRLRVARAKLLPSHRHGWLARPPSGISARPLIWLPNAIFLGLGIWLFNRIERR